MTLPIKKIINTELFINVKQGALINKSEIRKQINTISDLLEESGKSKVGKKTRAACLE